MCTFDSSTSMAVESLPFLQCHTDHVDSDKQGLCFALLIVVMTGQTRCALLHDWKTTCQDPCETSGLNAPRVKSQSMSPCPFTTAN